MELKDFFEKQKSSFLYYLEDDVIENEGNFLKLLDESTLVENRFQLKIENIYIGFIYDLPTN